MEHVLPQHMPRHEDQPRARVGILGNNGKDCTSTDSRIGFGEETMMTIEHAKVLFSSK